MHEQPAYRLLAAMALSAMVHGVILFAVSPQRLVSHADDFASISVRFEPASQEAAITAPSPRPRLQSVRSEAGAALNTPPVPQPAVSAMAPPLQAPPLDLPVLEDTTVYEVRELDSFPQPLRLLDSALLFPNSAAPTSVSIELVIDATGVVQEANLIDKVPDGADTVVAAFRSIPFTPAQRDGRAVRSRIAITMDFAD